MDKYAIIVAGGSGTRLGSSIPKQFLLLHNKPVLWYTITAFINAFDDITLILVLPEQHQEKGNMLISSFKKQTILLTIGGDTRYQSVENGLKLIPDNALVFIHDGVRCLLTPALIRRCYSAAILLGNAVPAIPAVDTIRIETASGNELLDRTKVRIVQTPQTFLSSDIKQAFKQGYQESFTDEASVIEKAGHTINLVEGELTNIKITTQTDLLIAEKILEERRQL